MEVVVTPDPEDCTIPVAGDHSNEFVEGLVQVNVALQLGGMGETEVTVGVPGLVSIVMLTVMV